jgi:hypothetical protein
MKSSGLPRGVCFVRGKFQASFRKNYLGVFATPEEASVAYKKALADSIGVDESEAHLYTVHGNRYCNYTVDPQLETQVGMFSWVNDGNGYPVGSINGRNKHLHIYIWELAGKTIPKGLEIDHINRDKSDCRLCNLRLATRSVNSHNRPSKNVSLYKDGKRWRGRVKVNGKQLNRICSTREEAAQWVDSVKQKVFSSMERE